MELTHRPCSCYGCDDPQLHSQSEDLKTEFRIKASLLPDFSRGASLQSSVVVDQTTVLSQLRAFLAAEQEVLSDDSSH